MPNSQPAKTQWRSPYWRAFAFACLAFAVVAIALTLLAFLPMGMPWLSIAINLILLLTNITSLFAYFNRLWQLYKKRGFTLEVCATFGLVLLSIVSSIFLITQGVVDTGYHDVLTTELAYGLFIAFTTGSFLGFSARMFSTKARTPRETRIIIGSAAVSFSGVLAFTLIHGANSLSVLSSVGIYSVFGIFPPIAITFAMVGWAQYLGRTITYLFDRNNANVQKNIYQYRYSAVGFGIGLLLAVSIGMAVFAFGINPFGGPGLALCVCMLVWVGSASIGSRVGEVRDFTVNYLTAPPDVPHADASLSKQELNNAVSDRLENNGQRRAITPPGRFAAYGGLLNIVSLHYPCSVLYQKVSLCRRRFWNLLWEGIKADVGHIGNIHNNGQQGLLSLFFIALRVLAIVLLLPLIMTAEGSCFALMIITKSITAALKRPLSFAALALFITALVLFSNPISATTTLLALLALSIAPLLVFADVKKIQGDYLALNHFLHARDYRPSDGFSLYHVEQLITLLQRYGGEIGQHDNSFQAQHELNTLQQIAQRFSTHLTTQDQHDFRRIHAAVKSGLSCVDSRHNPWSTLFITLGAAGLIAVGVFLLFTPALPAGLLFLGGSAKITAFCFAGTGLLLGVVGTTQLAQAYQHKHIFDGVIPIEKLPKTAPSPLQSLLQPSNSTHQPTPSGNSAVIAESSRSSPSSSSIPESKADSSRGKPSGNGRYNPTHFRDVITPAQGAHPDTPPADTPSPTEETELLRKDK